MKTYRVDIYAEADSTSPRSMDRKSGYVLECKRKNGEIFTVEEFSREIGTYHAVVLKALAKGLARINQSCEVHIHTQDEYILSSIDNNLSTWAANGWKTKKGDMLKNHFEWSRVWKHLSQHLVIIEPGMHSYYAWMIAEMGKGENAAHSGKPE